MSGKTLYISDLDGTLLNSVAELSGFTAETLKSLSARGIYFTAATARTAATAAKLLDGLGLRAPAVLMNGVCVFDVDKKEYIKVEVLADTVKQMAAQEGITEQLKAENQMLWVQRMNEVRETAMEIIYHDLIFV